MSEEGLTGLKIPAREGVAMSEERLKGWKKQSLCASYGDESKFVQSPLRSYMEVRDLGLTEATGGQFFGIIARKKKEEWGTRPTTGAHRHHCDFQFNYCLKGWIKFHFEGHEGEITFKAGDAWLMPGGIMHDVIEFSDDYEILELMSPAVHGTEAFEKMPEAAD